MKRIALFIAVIIALTACTQKGKKISFTEKIQYDVPLKNRNPDTDWWINNMEGSKREQFVTALVTEALNGEIDVYDYFTNRKLTAANLDFIRGRRDTLLTQSPAPPYNDTTIIIEHQLDYRDITKIRFLEEWSYDGKDIRTMEKKILAIAPLLENYDETGNFRGFQPLFWIYTEKP